MNSNVDKFFNEKLQEHRVEPSPEAWQKLESHLSKKNRMMVFVRVAASLLLVAAVGLGVIMWRMNSGDTETLSSTQAETQKEQVTPEQSQTKELPKQEIVSVPKKNVIQKVQPSLVRKAISTEPQPELVVEEPQVEIATETLVAEVVTAPKKEKRIVLVYSLPQVAPPLVVATATTQEHGLAPEEEKLTGLQKMMEVAKDVKNSDNPLGELREAKNDLFALEFKKDKNKSKNQ